MSPRTKRYALAFGVFLVLITVAYLLGAKGSDAMPEPPLYANEQIEGRSYPCEFPVPDPWDKSIRGRLRYAQWELTHRGCARLLRAASRAEKKAPTGLVTPQQVLTELGYKFPAGCYAREGVGHRLDIAHYPAVLKKLEKDLALQPTRAWRIKS